jgi:hypothetical protein
MIGLHSSTDHGGSSLSLFQWLKVFCRRWSEKTEPEVEVPALVSDAPALSGPIAIEQGKDEAVDRNMPFWEAPIQVSNGRFVFFMDGLVRAHIEHIRKKERQCAVDQILATSWPAMHERRSEAM